MKEQLLQYIRCPVELDSLDFYVLTSVKEDIVDGVLICSNGHWYPVIKSIPRLIVPELRIGNSFSNWMEVYRDQLIKLGLNLEQFSEAQVDTDTDFVDLKKEISQAFGDEWREFGRFGWDDNQYNMSLSETAFNKKTYFKSNDLKGKLTLDAGCGNGRYTHWAASYGAEVIGVELFDAVDVAYENTRNFPKVHIVQADVFQLPFERELFDVSFSIGVLQHTGNAGSAFGEISRTIKENGMLSVVVYGKGNKIYEKVVPRMRKKTTAMATKQLLSYINRLYKISLLLKKIKLYRIAKRFVYIEDHPHLLFNRYSVPVATHHSYDEVWGWYESNGYIITDMSKPGKGLLNNSITKAAPAIASRGIKLKK